MTGAEPIPEAWVGQRVLFLWAGGTDKRQTLTTLRGVASFGFLYDQECGGERLAFTPWSAIRWIRLATDADVGRGTERVEDRGALLDMVRAERRRRGGGAPVDADM